MITDKDREDADSPEELLSKMFRDIREIGYRPNPLRLIDESHNACINLIKQYEKRIRAESAEQALSDLPDDRLVGEITKRCRNGKKKFYSYMLSPLQNFNNPSADYIPDIGKKLAIAVKALEEIKTLGTHSTLSGRTTTGERIDSTTIINTYGIKARDALKEIQE